MIESNSCFWFLSTSLSKYCYSHYYIDWIKYCKVSWWFYCTDPKEIVFLWFRFLVCMDCFQLLLVLIILEVLLIIWLELGFLIIFLFILPSYYVLVVTWTVNRECFAFIHLHLHLSLHLLFLKNIFCIHVFLKKCLGLFLAPVVLFSSLLS